MGDDGVGDVDGVLQVPQHAVGAERRVVVGELRHPLLQPARRAFALISAATAAASRRGLADGLADCLDQRRERQLGVADEAVAGWHVLVDVGRIERRVDDGLALSAS